jgi:hypothetical protein
MEAGREEILMDRGISHDFRGRQGSIFRLGGFDRWGLLHALFYRLLIFASAAYGVLLLCSLAYPVLTAAVKATTVIVWILITPQLFAAIKAFSLASTKGSAFGHFSDAYSETILKSRKGGFGLYKALPYAVVAMWAVFFVLMILWWPA